MSDPFDIPPRKWPDDFRGGWHAELVVDGFRVRRLMVGARRANRGPHLLLTGMIFEEVQVGRLLRAAPLWETYEERQDGIGEVTGFVQAVIDAAWDAGMRPSQYRDATEELRAVRFHLGDMRAIVFDKPKPEKDHP